MLCLELDFKYNLLLFLLLRPEREYLKSGPEAPILSFNSQLFCGGFFSVEGFVMA